MTTPAPVNLDRLTLNEARLLPGRRVDVTFTIDKPVVPFRGYTVLGATDADDGTERSAVLKGECWSFGVGDRVTVSGTLRVVRHPAQKLDIFTPPAWVEVVVWAGR